MNNRVVGLAGQLTTNDEIEFDVDLQPIQENFGDVYLIIATIVGGLLVLIGTFSLKKEPLKKIFAFKVNNEESKE